ncbi:MAG: hypothetical protein HY211_01920 [Candidatus Omnitrophica bacterium]|nr:hypothetical protein [Candidatus Omnitrophota bacterium]
MGRVERIKRIGGCPIIYIGRAGRQNNGKHTLAKRYRNFFGSHTAMFPIWALLYSGWELEYGWLEKENPEFIEAELKQKYRNSHQGRLPALVKK